MSVCILLLKLFDLGVVIVDTDIGGALFIRADVLLVNRGNVMVADGDISGLVVLLFESKQSLKEPLYFLVIITLVLHIFQIVGQDVSQKNDSV